QDAPGCGCARSLGPVVAVASRDEVVLRIERLGPYASTHAGLAKPPARPERMPADGIDRGEVGQELVNRYTPHALAASESAEMSACSGGKASKCAARRVWRWRSSAWSRLSTATLATTSASTAGSSVRTSTPAPPTVSPTAPAS